MTGPATPDPRSALEQLLGHEAWAVVRLKDAPTVTLVGGRRSEVGSLLDAGLVGPPAPGSIFAYFSMTPKGGWFDTIAVVTTGFVVSLAVAATLMGFGRGEKDTELTRPEDSVIVGD